MGRPELILLHPPDIFRFRELPVFRGPVSDVVPSSSVFEIYPIGFLTISEYLKRHGINVRIINIAMKMMRDVSFGPEKFIENLKPFAFGIDLHWLPHVDGSLSLAEIVKRRHPDIPVIFGGLTATYYYREIMEEYPFVDFVVRGDSTEEPLRLLVNAIKGKNGYEGVPNLVWRDAKGRVIANDFSYMPEDLDYINFDYSHLLRMALKHRDPSGYIPFDGWLEYPVTAVFQCRGCVHNCGSCAGSHSAFRRLCSREKPCFRSPELLAEDIRRAAGLTGAPIMLIGDLLQAGEDYAERFLRAMRRYDIKNEIAIEFFRPPHREFVAQVAESLRNYNVEMSPESHDENVRRVFGKHYTNGELESSMELFIETGCGRIDLFFMTGLPYQDYASVIETARYCGTLLEKYGKSGRLLPMIAPLAPFIDPGSGIFEEPERYGYRMFYKTLKEHRKAMLMPSWKYTLNYETEWMTRDEIVRATYDAALMLVDSKARYGIIDKGSAEVLRGYIRRSIDIIRRIDEKGPVNDEIRQEIFDLNRVSTICGKHELEWPVRDWRFRALSFLRMLF